MRKLLLVLAPLALLAHVQVDTVIRLDSYLFEGCFIPELNKLYIQSRYRILVVDCSTYQLKAEIPIRPRDGVPDFAWNRQRQKLYFRTNAAPRVDSLLVIDAVGDTLIRWIPARYGGGPLAYVSSSDRLYFGIEGLDSSMLVLDCATDSVVNRIPVPISGMGFSSKSWDSVGNKLYAGIGVFGRPPMIAVYDCGTDSLLKVLDDPDLDIHGGLVFAPAHRKAYCPFFGSSEFGVICTKYDTVVRRLPIRGWIHPMSLAVAVNELNDKAYALGYYRGPGSDTLFVIDCVTDSIVKQTAYRRPYGPMDLVRWVPWSNRLHVSATYGRHGMVVDCNTDSIIVPELHLPGAQFGPIDIQLDPIRERIFAIGAETTSVHVLRDVVSGVTETAAPRARPAGCVRLRELRDRVELEYELAAPCLVNAAVFDPAGRRIATLAAGPQAPGLHRLVWCRTDRHAGRVAPGAYFILFDAGQERHRLKTVVE